MTLPNNVITREVLVTDLSQQMKKQRDFLKWMARRYKGINPEQSAAFTTGAELFEAMRQDVLAGDYDVLEEKEVFTNQGSRIVAGEHLKQFVQEEAADD